MINLRYHIVSLTAVFLALAVGVVMGTTFLNKQAVDQLNRQVKRAEQGIQSTRDQNAELRQELERRDRADRALEASGDRLLDNELSNDPVLVIASQNVDQDSLDRLRVAVGQAGGALLGTLRVTGRVAVAPGDDPTLAGILDETGTSRIALIPKLAVAVGTALADASDRSPNSTAAAPRLVRELIDAGYLSFEAGGESVDVESVLAGGGYRYVFVSGPDPVTADGDFLLPVLRAMVASRPPQVVVASAAVGADAEATRAAVVGPIRDDPALRAVVSTVDDLEAYVGQVATIQALADLDEGRTGHYGYGEGADSLLPEPA